LKALGNQFYGSKVSLDVDHLSSLFMTQRLGNMALHKDYFCYMQKLIIQSGSMNNPAYIKYYIRSFLGALPDAIKKYLIDKNINLEGMYDAMVDKHIKRVIQEHCLEKRVSKDFKQFEHMFTPSLCRDIGKMPKWGYGAHNRGHQCIHSSKCHCQRCSFKKKKYYTFKSRWEPNHPFHNIIKSRYKHSNVPCLKIRKFPLKNAICYNC
jgi:hypothetical protein